jgi:hypothetical protein
MGRLLSLPEHQKDKKRNILENTPGKDMPTVLEVPVTRPVRLYLVILPRLISTTHMNATTMQPE